MPTTENLKILIEVLDSFSAELRELEQHLAEVRSIAEAVDTIRIDVDVRGEGELAALQAELAALRAQGFGDIDVDAGRGLAGGGGGGGGRVDHLLSAQVAQLGRIIRDFDGDIGDASRAMQNMSRAADDAAEGFQLTNLRMSDLHNALARLFPMIFTVIGALPAAIAGLVALAGAAVIAAGALAALGGFAALGMAMEEGGRDDIMGGFGDIWDEVSDDFLDAFAPIAERLAPLFRDALDGLDRLFQRIANQEDAFMTLTDDAREFGQWVMDNLPEALGEMARFADAVSGALAAVGEGIGNVDWLDVMALAIERTLPHLIVLGSQIADMAPLLFDLSMGFLRVTQIILMFLQALLNVITIGGMFGEEVGIMIGTLLTFYSVILLSRGALVTTLLPALLRLGQLMVGAAGAIMSSNTTLFSWIGTAMGASGATLSLSSAMYVLAGAVAVATAGLSVILGATAMLGARFGDVGSNIDSATKSLKEFRREADRMDTGGRNPYRDPDLQRGEGVGRSRFSGSNISVTVEGDANDDTVRNQTHNALYRMERPTRGR